MEVHFITNNPFYILEVDPADKRTTIIDKAEEKAFFTDSKICEDAQTALLNPSKRLTAMINWFFDIPAEKITQISVSIELGKEINTDDLEGLAKLNALLFNFAITANEKPLDMGFDIICIDEQFNSINLEDLTTTINKYNKKAGIIDVKIDEVGREMNKKRDDIRHLIAKKMTKLNEHDCIELVTMLAEECIADEAYLDGVIISDVVDQYELKMQVLVDKVSAEILEKIDNIQEMTSEEDIEIALRGLINQIKEWDQIVQPLQLRAMRSGMAHSLSEEIGKEVRSFALWMNNEKGLSKCALSFIKEMSSVFAEIDELAEVFGKDVAALDQIVGEKEIFGAILPEMSEIADIIDLWEKGKSKPQLDQVCLLIEKIKALNKKIKSFDLDASTTIKIRKDICMMGRSAALCLHNEKKESELALRIAEMLFETFSDIQLLKDKLQKDRAILREQSSMNPKSDQVGKGCWLVIIAVIGIIFFFMSMGGEDNTPKSKQPVSNIKQSTQMQVEEKQFSTLDAIGTKVYVDIKSIFPTMGIYNSRSSHYHSFVCECKTSKGKKIWVYMSTEEYRKYFDANISTSKNSSSAETIDFPSVKRIHGIVKNADNIMYGIAAEIGSDKVIYLDKVD